MWKLDKHSSNVAVIDDRENEMTYSELAQAGEQLSDAIRGTLGNESPRCLVFNICDNLIGSLVGYVSFINNGIVPAMLRRSMDDELLSTLYTSYKPAFIWVPEEDTNRPLFSEMKQVFAEWGYVLLGTPFSAETELHPDLALLLTTSGSTGSPKFVRQSYANIRANTDSIVEYLHLDASERPITTLPMNYTYGISIINTHIDVGATILLTDKTLMQRELWGFFREQQATSFGGVPYTYEMLKRLRLFRMDLPSLRTMTQAGGKLLPELHDEFARWAVETGREFVVMYGASEATARMGWLPPERAVEKSGSMGIAIPGGRFELADERGELIEDPGVVGELVYYGDNVTMGYAESSADLTKGDERHGRYETGDMAQVDEDGFYYIVGRKKRFLKVYGNRVNLDDCERLLKAQFGGYEIACAGVDDVLYIFSTDNEQLPEMKAYLAEKTGFNQKTFKTVLLDEMPKNESGKLLYSKLAQYYEV